MKFYQNLDQFNQLSHYYYRQLIHPQLSHYHYRPLIHLNFILNLFLSLLMCQYNLFQSKEVSIVIFFL